MFSGLVVWFVHFLKGFHVSCFLFSDSWPFWFSLTILSMEKFCPWSIQKKPFASLSLSPHKTLSGQSSDYWLNHMGIIYYYNYPWDFCLLWAGSWIGRNRPAALTNNPWISEAQMNARIISHSWIFFSKVFLKDPSLKWHFHLQHLASQVTPMSKGLWEGTCTRHPLGQQWPTQLPLGSISQVVTQPHGDWQPCPAIALTRGLWVPLSRQ